jgi:hypothetical protein
VGIGDSVRTETPRRAPAPSPASSRWAARTAPAVGRRRARPRREAPPPVRRPSSRALAVPTARTGPLDAERARAASTRTRPARPPTTNAAAASNESHPGLTDFTRPAAPAPSGQRWPRPGSRAGAVARPASGTPPASWARPNATPPPRRRTSARARRRYQRYELEIRQRVNRVLEFPSRWRCAWSRGDRRVFRVGADGQLSEGPRVVKSSDSTSLTPPPCERCGVRRHFRPCRS